MALTDFQIKNAKAKDKPCKLAGGIGVYVLISPNGSKLWRLKYRFNRKDGSKVRLLKYKAYVFTPKIITHRRR